MGVEGSKTLYSDTFHQVIQTCAFDHLITDDNLALVCPLCAFSMFPTFFRHVSDDITPNHISSEPFINIC